MNKSTPSTVVNRLCQGVAILILAALASMTARAENGASKANAASSTNATPKSHFVLPSTTSEGRDPFFPLSARFKATPNRKNTDTVKPAPVTLTLMGISKTESGRFALINGKTLEAGEEREVPVGNGKTRVLCLEILEDAAIVQVNGSRQELRLRPGL